MEWQITLLLMMGILFLLLAMGVPIAVSLGVTSLGFIVATVGMEQATFVVADKFTGLWTSYSFLPIPLFIFMGELLFAGGTASDIFDIASKWFRRFPGGLALVTIVTCAIFATLSGSTLGATAAMGILAVPEMLKRGYDKRLSTGSVAAAGGLAHLIPPSMMAVIYASICELSVGKQLMAGFIPGFVLAAGFATVCLVWVWRDPTVAPREAGVSWAERLKVLRKGIGPVLIIVAVLGSIYMGIATVTEAAAIGAFAAFLLGVIGRRLTRKAFLGLTLSSVQVTCYILFIVVGAKILGWILMYLNIPQQALAVLTGVIENRWAILIMVQLVWIIMGTFMDAISIMLVTVPLLLPMILGLGFDPIWFGVLFLINSETATITPPVGFNLYIIKGIVPEDVTLGHIIRGAMAFMIADLVTLGVIMAFPQLALWLPSKMIGG